MKGKVLVEKLFREHFLYIPVSGLNAYDIIVSRDGDIEVDYTRKASKILNNDHPYKTEIRLEEPLLSVKRDLDIPGRVWNAIRDAIENGPENPRLPEKYSYWLRQAVIFSEWDKPTSSGSLTE